MEWKRLLFRIKVRISAGDIYGDLERCSVNFFIGVCCTRVNDLTGGHFDSVHSKYVPTYRYTLYLLHRSFIRSTFAVAICSFAPPIDFIIVRYSIGCFVLYVG